MQRSNEIYEMNLTLLTIGSMITYSLWPENPSNISAGARASVHSSYILIFEL